MATNSKVIEARNNPVVHAKLAWLEANWGSLSNVERWKAIKELSDRDCPYTDMGVKVNLTELAMRSYKRFAEPEKDTVIASGGLGTILQEIIEKEEKIAASGPRSIEPTKPLEPVISRKEKVKAGAHKLLNDITARQFHMDTIRMVEQRVDQWEVFGGFPRPVSPDVDPGAVVAAFDFEAMKTSPGALIEHLAVCLFRLLPVSSDRSAVIRELKAEKLAEIRG